MLKKKKISISNDNAQKKTLSDYSDYQISFFINSINCAQKKMFQKFQVTINAQKISQNSNDYQISFFINSTNCAQKKNLKNLSDNQISFFIKSTNNFKIFFCSKISNFLF